MHPSRTRNGQVMSVASGLARSGFIFPCVLGLHSRRIIGGAVSNRRKCDLAIRALKMAVAQGLPLP